MAKKKKRKRAPARSGPKAQTATRDDSPRERTAAEEGRSNRQAKKDEARRQREAIRRRMAMRRRIRQAVIAVVAVGVVAGIFLLVTRPSQGNFSASDKQLLNQAPAAAKTAGCDEVKNVGEYNPASQDRAHVGSNDVPNPPALGTYASVPPASGPHDAAPLGAGVYDSPPDIYKVIHSLEHGAAVVWYDPSATKGLMDEVAAVVKGHQDHVIMAPYEYPDEGDAGKLPDAKQMALVSWHDVRTCQQLSPAVVLDFIAHYRSPTIGGVDYKGQAPEAGSPI